MSGTLLPRIPPDCPAALQSLCLDCLCLDARERPDFETICDALKSQVLPSLGEPNQQVLRPPSTCAVLDLDDELDDADRRRPTRHSIDASAAAAATLSDHLLRDSAAVGFYGRMNAFSEFCSVFRDITLAFSHQSDLSAAFRGEARYHMLTAVDKALFGNDNDWRPSDR